MKTEDLLVLGVVGIAAYMLLKGGSNLDLSGSFGGGGVTSAPVLSYQGTPAAGYGGYIAPKQNQAWAGGQYGQPGQPSVAFAANTVAQASSPNAPATTVAAAQAVGSAPPRVVAKIKAGRVY